jgi:hypothetical protein
MHGFDVLGGKKITRIIEKLKKLQNYNNIIKKNDSMFYQYSANNKRRKCTNGRIYQMSLLFFLFFRFSFSCSFDWYYYIK